MCKQKTHTLSCLLSSSTVSPLQINPNDINKVVENMNFIFIFKIIVSLHKTKQKLNKNKTIIKSDHWLEIIKSIVPDAVGFYTVL